jgi:hypothetical protein
MNVIGAGFGRTGTLSFQAALEQLGLGPSVHMLTLLEDQALTQRWLDAVDGVPGALDAATEGFRSTVDWPGVYFWRELVERHPDAKVVLTVRDPEAWYESTRRTIYRVTLEAPEGPPPLLRMVRAMVWDGTFQGRFTDRDFAINVFERHIDEVRRAVPAGRLLEFEVKQGWGPLCDFLGVPVPDTEFPWLNDRAAFHARAADLE